jgi:hypothetical protein
MSSDIQKLEKVDYKVFKKTDEEKELLKKLKKEHKANNK